ncbi:hypothetical protein OXX69_000147 [Metschnikowia pulcherrima]
MIQLPEDIEGARATPYTSWKSQFHRAINAARIHNVPFLNVCIVATLGFFLAKLTTKFKELYMKNSLVTIIVTNLVLYGISETLAQSILSFHSDAPFISFSISHVDLAQHPGDAITLDSHVSPFSQPSFTDNEEVGSEDSDADEQNLDQFLSYLRSDTSLPYTHSAPEVSGLDRELAYFNFSRLAGFMCWGFVMAFVQCWWYRFLQIYSKHPQFVEVLRKVMSDQFCFSPISLFCFFTYGTIVLEAGTWADARAKLQKLYLQTLVINYCVWFPVQFINFLLVPRDFQVPFSSSISVLWNCFLSMRNSMS